MNGASDASSRIARAANGLVIWIARHWLALFNTVWGLYVTLPLAAPVLLRAGLDAPARAIYTLYSFTCHQLPDHSYFLFGPSFWPGDAELVGAGMSSSSNLFLQRVFVGNDAIGYKVALCQRDMAIYGAVLAAGLLFALLRGRMGPLSTRWFLVLLIPMALDGGTQLVGWRESTWWLRTLTGALFGMAAVWWAYPYVNEAMLDVLESESTRSPSPAA